MNATSPGMAMFRKELLDGRPLGILMLLNAGVVLAWFARKIGPYSVFGPSISELSSVTALLAPAIGLLIGVVYAFPESRGDSRAFLTHRPLDRSHIFAAVVGAAMARYLMALVVPIALMLASARMLIASPFDPLMVRPFIVDVITGAVWLLAGVACVMRRAPWNGTRVMPAIAAVVLSSMTVRPLTFAPALALALAALAVNTALAWGAFVSGGQDDEQPAMGRAALIVTALLAYGGIASMASAIAILLGTASVPVRPPESVRLTAAGALIRATRDDDQGGTMRTASAAIALSRFTDGVGRYQSYRSGADLIVQLEGPGYGPWYFVKRARLFEHYYRNPHRRVGWLGPDGFSPDSGGAPPARRFQGSPLVSDGSMPVTIPGEYMGFHAARFGRNSMAGPIAFRDAVYTVESNTLAIRAIFTAPPGETVLAIGAGSYDNPKRTVTQAERDSVGFGVVVTNAFIYVLTDDTVRTKIPTAGMALDTRPVIRIVRHPDLAAHPTVVHVLGNGTMRSFLFDSLAVLRDTTVVAFDARRFETTPWVTAFAAVLTPPVLELASLTRRFDPLAHSEFRQVSIQAGSPRLGWVALVGLLSAVVAFFVARRRLFSGFRLVGWVALAAGFGPIGLLALRDGTGRPVRERCPACGRGRLITREHCEHCAAPFPPPALDGTEILLPAAM
jgi:hypothetical protein